MSRDALLAAETKITLAFMVLGLTAWYLVGTVADSDLLEVGALLGVGVVLPTLINELRRRSGSESEPGAE
ncbi:hypothetical protein [Natronomonas moolapensis]|nr:hypothetical protein [Natronomonas moolapensis]